MSVAQQPDPRLAPGAGGALAAGLALLAAALLVSATLLATRRPSATPAITDQSHTAPREGASARTPARGAGATARSVSRPGGAAHRKPARPVPRPIVQIVERRVPIPQPYPPSALPSAAPPFPRWAPGDRASRTRDTVHPPADVVELPPPTPGPPSHEADRIAELDAPPEPTVRPEARYPEDAAAEDATGAVRLKVIVDRRGRVDDAIVVRSAGDDRLDRAAEEAVRQWRYRPARRNGRAVTGVDYVVIDFYREGGGRPDD